MQFKVCTTCGNEFPATVEYFTKTNKGMVSTLCRKCKSEYDREYRTKNKDRIKRHYETYMANCTNLEKRNKRCKQWRIKNQEKIKEYRESHKDEMKERNKEYWAKNKEEEKKRISIWRDKNKQKIKKYRQNTKERSKNTAKIWYHSKGGYELSRLRCNRRRAKIKGLENNFSKNDWEYCKNHFRNENQNICCAYCGQVVEKVEQEHFIPLSKGGNYTKDNILPACRACNGSKSTKDFNDWYKHQEFYSEKQEEKILNYFKLVKEGASET